MVLLKKLTKINQVSFANFFNVASHYMVLLKKKKNQAYIINFLYFFIFLDIEILPKKIHFFKLLLYYTSRQLCHF